ncbi:MAG TPA: hypothetical protein PLP82_05460 [Deltaproteobacteria bacterium]|jgi:hypothetical protein|nr:hypothetical protein [Deltaproteobacteria bacterium]OQC28721.1 MAG: hypothetical protein BWX71_00686 [Deltaproteobacteria bacterium ADurb.Bin072]HRW79937.1 hypothetical protein [Desulfomonilia bacterium]HNQ86217.1 hypothetical protein [Deltaproteobacteria bacterium]HNS90453.1 hypothetical protein [Deltaproteobacteria bacterium]
MRNRVLLVWILFLLVLPGCGRKLPPLPPTEPDPVEIGSIRFEEGRVVARIRCNVADATVTLLGKPKGICPHCTDDLTVRDTGVVEKPGDAVLADNAPQAESMVYRLAVEHWGARWMTPARIVVKR